MNEMEKILREILAADKTILSRRDDLLAALEKKVPNNLRRDYAPIKRAINLNVGEIFFVGESNEDATKVKVVDILKSSGMQETRINFVIETFTKALEQIKIPEVVEETVAKSKINTVKAAKKISLPKIEESVKVEEPPKIFEPEKTLENIIEETNQHFEELQNQSSIKFPPQEENVIEQTSQHFDKIQSQNVSQTLQDAPPFLPQNHKSKIFTTEGRLNRWAYFVQSLKVCGIAIIGGILSGAIIGIPIVIAAVVGGIMVGVRRLHDLNKSGWWILISFIPYVDIIFGLYMTFFKGTDGYNKYGPDPLRE